MRAAHRWSLALDITALPLPPEARAVLRTIADDVRRPPPGATADPIALRRWLDGIGRRLDGLAAIRAGAAPAPASVGRQGLANPRAALREQDRPAGIVVETRRRGRPG
ncbi:hypothetical protein D3273_23395 [Lichenibacterium minor]|uniref:Uncharacterized protein n=1 Tax=Lichenibacterium minor TaxID=2316528 RepID=A0A4Q2U433_9HYPH|nr:hypothetical protein [Lichenibacterium minor]RYC29535.1 hypothetical protein D3273_23395 [Lichenibacterium minor]